MKPAPTYGCYKSLFPVFQCSVLTHETNYGVLCGLGTLLVTRFYIHSMYPNCYTPSETAKKRFGRASPQSGHVLTGQAARRNMQCPLHGEAHGTRDRISHSSPTPARLRNGAHASGVKAPSGDTPSIISCVLLRNTSELIVGIGQSIELLCDGAAQKNHPSSQGQMWPRLPTVLACRRGHSRFVGHLPGRWRVEKALDVGIQVSSSPSSYSGCGLASAGCGNFCPARRRWQRHHIASNLCSTFLFLQHMIVRSTIEQIRRRSRGEHTQNLPVVHHRIVQCCSYQLGARVSSFPLYRAACRLHARYTNAQCCKQLELALPATIPNCIC